MDDADHFWAHEKTLGGRARDFWWRLDGQGNLTLRRVESARRGPRGVAERTVTRAELEALQAHLADAAWHPLSPGAPAAGATARHDPIGAFLHQKLGWSAQATVLAGHLAALFTQAGLWQWDGSRRGMLFRQLAPGLGKLAELFARRQAEAAAPDAPAEPAPPTTAEPAPRQEPPRFNRGDKFRARSKMLRGRFDECSAGGKHAVEKGQRREGAVREFLRAELPPCYGVTRGEVVAETGEASRQMDILIYDRWAPVLLDSPSSRLLAAESIYAAIEVKPRLTLTELRNAVVNLRSLKALPRSATMWPGGPFSGGPPPPENPPVFAAIFSFEAVHRHLITRELRKLQQGLPPILCIDCICILDDALIHRDMGMPGTWAPALAAEITDFACVPAGAQSLASFHLLLLQDITAKTLAPPNLLHYSHGFGLPPAEDV